MMNQKVKSQRTLSTNSKRETFDNSQNKKKNICNDNNELLLTNTVLKKEIHKLKQINLNYATMLNAVIASKYPDDNQSVPKQRTLREMIRNLIVVNTNLKKQLEIERKAENQYIQIKKYMEQKNISNLPELYQLCTQKTKTIQAQIGKISELENQIIRIKEIKDDQSEINQLKKQLKESQEKNQSLEAKCAKLIQQLQKSVKHNNLQKVQSYHAQIKLKQLERREKLQIPLVKKINIRQKQNNSRFSQFH